MVDIKSPIINTTRQQKLRTFEVTDESNLQDQYDYSPEARYREAIKNQQLNQQKEIEDIKSVERQIDEARTLKANKVNPLTSNAKDRIKYLSGLGREYTEVVLDDVVFKLSTLKSKELREVILECSKINTNAIDIRMELRRQQLARSIVEIDNVPIHLIVGGEDLQLKLTLIDELEESVVEKLDNEYNKLADKAKNKYSLKSESDVKEVSEDLKK